MVILSRLIYNVKTATHSSLQACFHKHSVTLCLKVILSHFYLYQSSHERVAAVYIRQGSMNEVAEINCTCVVLQRSRLKSHSSQGQIKSDISSRVGVNCPPRSSLQSHSRCARKIKDSFSLINGNCPCVSK